MQVSKACTHLSYISLWHSGPTLWHSRSRINSTPPTTSKTEQLHQRTQGDKACAHVTSCYIGRLHKHIPGDTACFQGLDTPKLQLLMGPQHITTKTEQVHQSTPVEKVCLNVTCDSCTQHRLGENACFQGLHMSKLHFFLAFWSNTGDTVTQQVQN